MKKIILFLTLFISIAIPCSAFELNIKSTGAVMLEADTSQVLFSLNENEQFDANALNDLLMTYVGAVNLKDNEFLTAEGLENYVKSESFNLYLKDGEALSKESVLNAIMLSSATDAKLLLAKKLSGGFDEFCVFLNETAKSLGALNSDFTNCIGKNPAKSYTTLKDISSILQNALKNEQFLTVFKNKSYVVPTNDVYYSERHLKYYNPYFTEEELKELNITAIKTTFTTENKNQVAVLTEKEDRTLLIVLKGGNDFKSTAYDIKSLIAYGSTAYNKITVKKDKIPSVKEDIMRLTANEDASFLLKAGYTEKDLKYVAKDGKINVVLPNGEVISKINADGEKEMPAIMIITRIVLFTLVALAVLVIVFAVLGIVNSNKKKKLRKERLEKIMQEKKKVKS